MKKTARTEKGLKVIFLIIVLFSFLTGSAQNAKQTADGNYIAIKADTARSNSDTLTGKYFTDNAGKKYQVYASKKGKLFIVRTSLRTGNQYKQYLKTE